VQTLEQGSTSRRVGSAPRKPFGTFQYPLQIKNLALQQRDDPPTHRVSGRPKADLKTHCSHAKGTTHEAI
jgi:hypothetical protein